MLRANTTVRLLPRSHDELVRMSPPAAIHNDADCRRTQQMIDALTSLPKLTKGQLLYLDTLTVLLEAYEEEHERAFSTDAVGPVEVLQSLMDEHGMTSSDLGRVVGERSLGSKILSGQRQLSKTHIRRLAEHFHVGAELFL
jgi:HTH-type transcriptional regulator / antitoxin HigA